MFFFVLGVLSPKAIASHARASQFSSSEVPQRIRQAISCLRKGKPLTKQLGFSNYTTPGDMANHLPRPSQMPCLCGVSSWPNEAFQCFNEVPRHLFKANQFSNEEVTMPGSPTRQNLVRTYEMLGPNKPQKKRRRETLQEKKMFF